MDRETGVIAVAGARRLFITFWAGVFVFLALVFFGIAGMRLFGTVGVVALMENGAELKGEATETLVLHIGITVLYLALGAFFVFMYKVAMRSISATFVEDIEKTSKRMSEVIASTKSGAKSWREAARSPSVEAKSLDGDGNT